MWKGKGWTALISAVLADCLEVCPYLSSPQPLSGNLAQAELIGREALRLLPHDPTIMFSLANVLGKLEKYKVGIGAAWMEH